MSDRNFVKIGDLLPGLLKQLGLQKKFNEQRILELWRDVVGENLAERSQATKIDRGVLYVRVEHGAWMQELQYIERNLLRELRRRAPDVAVRKIHFSPRTIT